MGYRPMEEAPRDGSDFDVMCISKNGFMIEIKQLHYAYKPMFKYDPKQEMILWGTKNFLSSYLTPLGWKPRDAEHSGRVSGQCSEA